MSAPSHSALLALWACAAAGAPSASAAASPSAAEYRRLAQDCLDLEDLVCASANVKRALELDPADSKTLKLHLWIGIVRSERQQQWHALTEADRRAEAEGISPEIRAQALLEVARLRQRIGDAAGAERDYARALSLNPGDGEAANGLAEVLRESPERALPYAELAVRGASTPRRLAAFHRLAGEIQFDLGDLSAARRSLGLALASDKNDLDTLRALARTEEDNPGKARDYARRIARAAESSPAWHRGAAMRFSARVWLDLGEDVEARASLDRALAVDPDDMLALEMLGRLRPSRPGSPSSCAVPASAAAAPSEPALLASPEDARRFERELAQAPLWQHVDGLRLLARSWLALGDRAKALRKILEAEETPRSVMTSKILSDIDPGGEYTERDLAQARAEAAQTRARLASACAAVAGGRHDGVSN